MEAPFNVPNNRFHIHRHYHSHRCPLHSYLQLEYIHCVVQIQQQPPPPPPYVAIVRPNGPIFPVEILFERIHQDLPQLQLSYFFPVEIERIHLDLPQLQLSYFFQVQMEQVQQPGDGDDEEEQVQEQGDIQVNENGVAVEEENGNRDAED